MSILVFGKSGQLASEFSRIYQKQDVQFCSHEEVNFLSPESIVSRIREAQPKMIINASAYTAVDKAETEKEVAFQINATSVGVIAEEAKKIKATLFHFSTDYIFDGEKSGAYSEHDKTNPKCVYGASKLLGEKNIQATGVDYIILRVSWIYGKFGKNFLKTMIRLGKEKESLSVVSDQVGTPTLSQSIALTTQAMLNDRDLKNKLGTYHFSDGGSCSWHQFAEQIFSELRKGKQRESICVKNVKPILSHEYPSPVKRPKNSVLDNSKISHTFTIPRSQWTENLQKVLKEMESEVSG